MGLGVSDMPYQQHDLEAFGLALLRFRSIYILFIGGIYILYYSDVPYKKVGLPKHPMKEEVLVCNVIPPQEASI